MSYASDSSFPERRLDDDPMPSVEDAPEVCPWCGVTLPAPCVPDCEPDDEPDVPAWEPAPDLETVAAQAWDEEHGRR